MSDSGSSSIKQDWSVSKSGSVMTFILLSALLLRIIMLISYSPLIVGDGEEYWNMLWQMANGNYQSNLIFCSGYPFLMSLPTSIFLPLWDSYPDIAYRLLLIIQHTLGVFLALLIFGLVRRTVSNTAGVIAGFLVALSPIHAAWANQIRPEFMLTFLIVLSLWLLVYAGRRATLSLYLYVLAGVVGGLTLLVRFNALILIPVMILIIWVYGQKRLWQFKMGASLLYLALVFMIYFSYIAAIHHSSTGSWQYSHILGLSLKNRVLDAGILFDRTNGPCSQQLVRYHYAEVPSLENIPKPSSYAQRLGHPVDKDCLGILLNAPEPVESTAARINDNKILYFLDFEKGNELMTRASAETILKHPWEFIRDIPRSFAGYFTHLHEFDSDFLLPPPKWLDIHQIGLLGFARVTMPIKGKWGYKNPTWVWLPGMTWLTWYYSVYRFINVLYLPGFIVSLALFLASPRKRIIIGIYWGVVAVWLVGVSLVAVPGPRYRVPIEPMLDVLLAISLAWAIERFRRCREILC